MSENDDSIELTPNPSHGNKTASDEKPVKMFDKTSYENEDKPKDPLEVDPGKHA